MSLPTLDVVMPLVASHRKKMFFLKSNKLNIKNSSFKYEKEVKVLSNNSNSPEVRTVALFSKHELPV